MAETKSEERNTKGRYLVRARSVIGCIVLFAVLPAFSQGGPPGGFKTVVETAVVETRMLRSTVRAVGTLLADASATLRAEVPGQVLQIHFDEGQRIGTGARLFTLEATVLEAEVNEAQANAEQSEAAYKRATELIGEKLISATEFDAARANYNVSIARLLSSQARLSKTTIRAPFDGFVGLREINIGDYATTGQELVSVVSLNPLRVEFSVPETLLAQLAKGQSIDVSVGAYPNETFRGTITAIAPQIDVQGHSVAIRASLANPDLKLRPGLFAQVSVTLVSNPHALVIPEQAIWPVGQDKTVFVVVDGIARQTVVTIGQRQPGEVEVLEGLADGDEIVTAGQMKLFDGAAVQPKAALAGVQ